MSLPDCFQKWRSLGVMTACHYSAHAIGIELPMAAPILAIRSSKENSLFFSRLSGCLSLKELCCTSFTSAEKQQSFSLC
jgi:hypothetical protein